MQVYKELRIISARPDIFSENLAHKLYGFISGNTRCSAFLWSDKALEIKML